MADYKERVSITVTTEVRRILNQKGNISSYLNELVLKDFYQSKNDLVNKYFDEKDKKYYEVRL